MGEPQFATAPELSLDELLQDVADFEVIFDSWDESQKGSVQAYRKSVDDLHREAFRRLIGTVKSEPKAMSALKSALGDEVVYAVLQIGRAHV